MPAYRRLLPLAVVVSWTSQSVVAAAAGPQNATPQTATTTAPQGAATPAEPAGNADAREHYQRGIAYYKEGDFKLSLVEFRRAYELTHNYRILYNLGRVHHQLNDYARALTSLEQYLREGGGAIPPERRAEVENDVNDLRGRTAHLEVKVDVASADVFVDGVPIGKSPLTAPVLLDVGDHHVEVQRNGYESARKVVTLAPRDDGKVEMHLEESKARVVVAPASAPTDATVAKSKAPMWIGWATTGALAIGAGVTGAMAASKASQLDAMLASPDSTADERAATKRQAHTLAIATDVLAASAIVASGVSLYFTLRSSGESPRPNAPHVAAGLCGASVCASGSF